MPISQTHATGVLRWNPLYFAKNENPPFETPCTLQVVVLPILQNALPAEFTIYNLRFANGERNAAMGGALAAAATVW
jgi:hypothetical protein